MDKALFQIQGVHKGRMEFDAGFEVNPLNDRVNRAAPIIKYLEGKTIDEVTHICESRGWELIQIA